jgi:hypothetical protein
MTEMNAHVSRRPIAALALGSACPAETLARRWAAVWARRDELEAGATTTDHGFPEREEEQLRELAGVLEQQLEWVRPESLAGVYAQFLQLGGLARELFDNDDPHTQEQLLRRFNRLNGLALEGLERLAGINGDVLGKRDKTVRSREFQAAFACGTTGEG